MHIKFSHSFAPGYDKSFLKSSLKYRFQAIAACTKDGRPNFEQLKMNGMLPR